MRVVTVGAGDLPFQNRMMIREVELASLIEVTLKARFRTFARVDDSFGPTPDFDVDAAGTMARLASSCNGVSAWGH